MSAQVHDVEKQIERLTLSTSNVHVHTQKSKGQLLLFYYYFNVSINNCSLDFIHVGDTDTTHATKSDGELATTAEHKLEGDSHCTF